MKNTKVSLLFVLTAVFALFLCSTSTLTSANDWNETSIPDIAEMAVKINGDMIWYGNCNYNDIEDLWGCSTYQYAILALEREETIEITATFIANRDIEEVKVKAWITGYRDDIEFETSNFDIFAGSAYIKTMSLDIPSDIDARDNYTLHIELEQKKEISGVDEAEVTIEVQRAANLIEILSVDTYAYSASIESGDLAYIDVVVKNTGNYNAEDVYVKASIDKLGISRKIYLGDLEPNDSEDEDTEEITIILPIPENAEGTYTLEIEAYNKEISDKEFESIVIGKKRTAVSDGEIEVTAQITSIEIEQGKGSVYTLLVSNSGSETESFIIESAGTENWATTQINPQTFSLKSGESKLVNVYVAVSEDSVITSHIFTVLVKYGGEIKQKSLTAVVTKTKTSFAIEPNFRTVMIVIAIILGIVILALLIIVLAKTTKAEKTDENYY